MTKFSANMVIAVSSSPKKIGALVQESKGALGDKEDRTGGKKKLASAARMDER
jgi:hypothetical protein